VAFGFLLPNKLIDLLIDRQNLRQVQHTFFRNCHSADTPLDLLTATPTSFARFCFIPQLKALILFHGE